MKGDFKFLVLFLIVMPFGLGSSFLIVPNKLLQALPEDYGRDLSVVQGDVRRLVDDWLGGILNLMGRSNVSSEDGQNNNLARNVEVQIPPDILLKVREGKVARGEPIPNDISTSPPNFEQVEISEIKRAKPPQITRYELSSQPNAEGLVLEHQIKSEKSMLPARRSINLIKNMAITSGSKVHKLRSGSYMHREVGLVLKERPLVISLSQQIKNIAGTNSIPLKRHTKPISAPSPDPELSIFSNNTGPGALRAFNDLRSNQQIPNQYVRRPANGELDSRMSQLEASALLSVEKELNVVLPEMISGIDLSVPQGNRTQSASMFTAERGALGYTIEKETLPSNTGAVVRSSSVVKEAEEYISIEPKAYMGKAGHNRGMRYYWGDAVPKNLKKAAKWFRIAAKKGDVRSQYKLGIMALVGQGMRRNYTKAAKWLKMASKQDHPAAQYNLGLLYFAGHGVPKDDLSAYFWFDRAATLGDKHAKKARDTLRHLLPAGNKQN